MKKRGFEPPTINTEYYRLYLALGKYGDWKLRSDYKAKYVKGAINSNALNIINKIEVKISAVIKINLTGSLFNITNLYN